jgi:pimeloyl-ACP methyl ester carboxylesterase
MSVHSGTARGLEPFPIEVSDEVLADLDARLANTRWALDPGNEDWFYGVNRAYLRELVSYWREGFSWRAAERSMNRYDHYRVTLDDIPVHLMRVPGKGPDPIPLILSHGWPWTFWHWSRIIDALADPAAHGGDAADAFEVIVPSLPGFGFSAPLSRPDVNFWKTADVWHTLMTETLGFERYAAAGCDMGALVTGQLGHKYADHLYGIHLGSQLPLDFFSGERPWDVSGGAVPPREMPAELRRQALSFVEKREAHVAVHILDSQTQAFGLNDSPIGMLAWILERWRSWSENSGDVEEVFSKDEMLTHAMVYWVNQTIGSSMRMYSNAARYKWQPSHDRSPTIEAPTGFTFLGGENPPGIATEDRARRFLESPRAATFNTVYTNAHEHGGHFGPWENPDAFIGDIRATFRLLRTPVDVAEIQ